MKTLWARTYVAVKSGWNAMLGIQAEILLVAAIIGACFLVCFLWWAIAQ